MKLVGGDGMNNEGLWNNFLEIIQEDLSTFSFDTWFKDTKLHSLKNNVATVIVPVLLTKKHLEDNYLDMMIEVMNKLTGNTVSFNFILEDEIVPEDLDIVNYIVTESSGNDHNYADTNLNSDYTFETFVVGNSNRFAYTASRAVAESPGKTYNPLFLYGESGVGKTHLMHAIGNYIFNTTNKKVLYVPSDKFVDDYTRIFRYNDKNNFDKIDNFKSKYRSVDVLIVDDIQFLGNASKGQEEFFHTFNELQSMNKQIIIASDRSVDDLKSVENRLLTRLNGGLTANILTPDYDLRVSLIKNKLKYNEAAQDIPNEVIEYIANNFDSDIRALGGAITRVLAYSTMFNKGVITLDLAVDALKDLLKDKSYYKNDVQRIQKVVCSYYKISIDDMKGKNKNNSINFPRQVAIYLCRVLTSESFPKIGTYFGGRNHSTIISAYQKIEKELEKNDKLKNVIKDLKNNLS